MMNVYNAILWEQYCRSTTRSGAILWRCKMDGRAVAGAAMGPTRRRSRRKSSARSNRVGRVDPAFGHDHGLGLALLPLDHQLVERAEIGLGRGDQRIGIGALG